MFHDNEMELTLDAATALPAFFTKNDLARYSFIVEAKGMASQFKMYFAEGASGDEYIAHRKP